MTTSPALLYAGMGVAGAAAGGGVTATMGLPRWLGFPWGAGVGVMAVAVPWFRAHSMPQYVAAAGIGGGLAMIPMSVPVPRWVIGVGGAVGGWLVLPYIIESAGLS